MFITVAKAATIIAMNSSALLEALGNPLFGFLRTALIAGLLSSVVFGIIGTYVVTKRITYVAGAIAHCALGGIGFALYARHELGWIGFDPMLGAFLSAIGSALLIGCVVLSRSEREDTIIGAVWVTGMALGILFVKKVRRAGVNIESWLFGDINFVSDKDLWTVTLLGAGLLLLTALFHKQFVAICFDEEFARARGLSVPFYYLLLLCMTAVSVVLLVHMIGIIMVIALLTLPPAISSRFAPGLPMMMFWSTVLCGLFIIGGMEISLRLNTVVGPTIILVSAAAYLATLLISRFRGKCR
jgi:zinc transport system permease protein